MSEIEWIPLAQWSKHFKYPSQGSIRNVVARRRENGADAFLSLMNGRFYVNPRKFNEWMESKKENNTPPVKKARR